jgi:hypothetical protein
MERQSKVLSEVTGPTMDYPQMTQMDARHLYVADCCPEAE